MNVSSVLHGSAGAFLWVKGPDHGDYEHADGNGKQHRRPSATHPVHEFDVSEFGDHCVWRGGDGTEECAGCTEGDGYHQCAGTSANSGGKGNGVRCKDSCGRSVRRELRQNHANDEHAAKEHTWVRKGPPSMGTSASTISVLASIETNTPARTKIPPTKKSVDQLTLANAVLSGRTRTATRTEMLMIPIRYALIPVWSSSKMAENEGTELAQCEHLVPAGYLRNLGSTYIAARDAAACAERQGHPSVEGCTVQRLEGRMPT